MSVEEMPPYKYGSVQKQIIKIDRITYDRKVNLGNYETEQLSASAQIDENEDPVEAFTKLRHYVHRQLKLIKDDVDAVDEIPW